VTDPVPLPDQSPLFHAQHAARYDRQTLISAYEERYGCRLAVMLDTIFPLSVTAFEELVYNADPEQDLHLLLFSPGGDGETAIRLVRSAQARCRELTVIVPDQAKSAGTVLAMGAHRILMGPTSDLGPVDPQFQLPGGLASAKDIIAAVENAEQRIQAAPETYPLYVALLSDISGLMVQQARSALERSSELVGEALASNPERSDKQTEEIKARLRERLIDLPQSHAAIFDAKAATDAGLPVEYADPSGEQWQTIWRLWGKYMALGAWPIYEGSKASQTGTAFTPTTTSG
jgi:hypothetical protein